MSADSAHPSEIDGAQRKWRVLMVCLGNICRSPTAEQVLRVKLGEQGLADVVEVDSAGTHGHWHEGQPPDPRSVEHARRRGYDLSALRARPVRDGDFDRFDLILAMDPNNQHELESRRPPRSRASLRRLTEFATRHKRDSVPDPYYGGAKGFEAVLDLIEDACAGVVRHLHGQIHSGS